MVYRSLKEGESATLWLLCALAIFNVVRVSMLKQQIASATSA